jgi:hypothetical protein
MAITHGTTPFQSRMTAGTLHYKNLYNNTFGYTEVQKKAAAASSTAVHAAINGSLSAQTVTTSITDPDVPRALRVVVGGTAGDVADSRVQITGTNVEGKTMTESFRTTAGATGTINGTKAFQTVTSIVIEAQLGTGCTFSVGYQNKLGIRHRLFPQNTTVRVYTNTTAYGALTVQAAPTVVADNTYVENNLITPATAPDGTLNFIIAYTYDNWSDGTVLNDQPEYIFTTSTSSTSTSTSTSTITTSTSSTSSSTSSTSSSTSSTSSSTSSTSTSTTTTP